MKERIKEVKQANKSYSTKIIHATSRSPYDRAMCVQFRSCFRWVDQLGKYPQLINTPYFQKNVILGRLHHSYFQKYFERHSGISIISKKQLQKYLKIQYIYKKWFRLKIYQLSHIYLQFYFTITNITIAN